MKQNKMTDVNLTTYFLAMSRPNLFDEPSNPEGLELTRLDNKTPEYCQFLFSRVGGPFRWYSRADWNYQQWHNHVQCDDVEIYVAVQGGAPIGYFELVYDNSANNVELKFIGLMPSVIGKGYGRWILNAAIFQSFNNQRRCNRLWLHTCSEDHPSALQNYIRRGFVLEKEEKETDRIPDSDSLVWLGATFTKSYLEVFSKSNDK